MPYQVEIAPRAIKFLKSIPEKDRDRVVERIKDLSVNPRNDHVVKLTDRANTYRARQGNYRIFFTIQDSKLIVELIEVSDRKDSYGKR